MLSYIDFTSRFGSHLSNENFESFLLNTFADLTTYNVVESSYIISENMGIELGFQNEDTVFDEDDLIVFEEDHPIFSHFNLYPKSTILVQGFPFGLTFKDKRSDVHQKAGQPALTKEGDFLGQPFLIDHYKVNNMVISVDYNANDLIVKHIQIRDNDLLQINGGEI